MLWGTDNLKTEGGPIAQALALIGAQPRFDSYGRLAGAELIPLEELGRPRVDVLATLSGIFRDLLPLQTKLLAEASFLAACADEPVELNFVRKHALAYQREHGCDLETAALRVFGNAEGAYGSNVNHMIENGRWDDEDELAETYTRRKCFAYGRTGRPVPQAALLQQRAGRRRARLPEPRLGRARRHHRRPLLRHAGRHQPRGAAAPRATRGARSISATRPAARARCARWASRWRWRPAPACSTRNGTRACSSTATRACARSRPTSPTPWAGRRRPARWRPGSTSSSPQTFVLDAAMRERLAALNPTASAKVANRLLEAHERNYWSPDAATLEALREAGEELEDRLEGIGVGMAA